MRASGLIEGTAIAIALLAATAVGQDVAVSLTDGTVVRGQLAGLANDGPQAHLVLHFAPGEEHRLPLSRVLAVHGAPPQPQGDAVIRLVGGDEIRGAIMGGDDAGDQLTVRSRILGEFAIPVDRLAAIVFPERAGARGIDEHEPSSGADEEVLFRPTGRGVDTIVGTLHRFAPNGVLFAWDRRPEPELFPYDGLAGIALRGGTPRSGEPNAQVVTVGGDVVSGMWLGVDGARLDLAAESGQNLRLAIAELAVLTVLRPQRRFLSDLDPVRVEERGTPFDDGQLPLHRHRRDRTVTGRFLVVGGLTFAKGLGVHSRCALTYRVPEGCTAFHAWVGVDAEVLETSVRGTAEVSVHLAGEEVFGPRTVRAGEPPRSTGVLQVEPGALVTLEVDFGEGWFLGDRVDWLAPVLFSP